MNETTELEGFTTEQVRAAEAIAGEISGLSEELFCASWLIDSEFQAWRVFAEGGTWAGVSAEARPLLALSMRQLAENEGVWVRYETGTRWPKSPYRPVALEEWKLAYGEWKLAQDVRVVELRALAAEKGWEDDADESVILDVPYEELLERARAKQ